MNDAAENKRLDEAREKNIPWKKWGPYLSERQWGTVREDYSEGGDAWNYFTHDQARSRASHQTGWTGLVAKAIQIYGFLDAKRALEGGKEAAFVKGASEAGEA
jgi:hypothetical protein